MTNQNENTNSLSFNDLLGFLQVTRTTYISTSTLLSQCKRIQAALGNISAAEKIIEVNRILKSTGSEMSYEEYRDYAASIREQITEGEKIAFSQIAEQIIKEGASEQTVLVVKEAIKRICFDAKEVSNLCKELNLSVQIPDEEEIKTDLVSFFIYVAAQDKVIGPQEIDLANSLFDIEPKLDAVYFHNLLNAKDELFAYQNNVSDTAVMLFVISQKIDLHESGENGRSASCAESIIRLYTYLGLLAAVSDGDADESEIEYVGKYIQTLNEFFLDNASYDTEASVSVKLTDLKKLRLRQIPQEELAKAALKDGVADTIEETHQNTTELIQPANQSGWRGLIASYKLTKHEKEHAEELDKKEKQLRLAKEELDNDKRTYDDNLFILSNYDDIILKQEAIIIECEEKIERLTPELEAAEVALAAVTADLVALQSEHSKELEPLNEKRADIQYEYDEIELKLKDFEYEKDELERKKDYADESDQAGIQNEIEKFDLEIEDLEHRLSKIKSKIDDVDFDISIIKSRHESEAAPLEAAVAGATFTATSLRDEYETNRNRRDSAKHRIDRCNYVFNNPEVTPKLAEKIKSEEDSVASLNAIVEGMRLDHEQLKAATEKGKIAVKIAIGVGVALLVIIIVVCVLVKPPTTTSKSPTSSTSTTYSAKSAQSSTSSSSSNTSNYGRNHYTKMSFNNGRVFASVPDYEYAKTSGNSSENYSSPEFGITLLYSSLDNDDLKSISTKAKLLDLYDSLLEVMDEKNLIKASSVTYGTIHRGSFDKGDLLGSTREITVDGNKGLVFITLVNGTVYIFAISWTPEDAVGVSQAEHLVESFSAPGGKSLP